MRPIRLAVEGFTSFRDPQEIDFSDLDLFVITGPTGSGKTSILDAVSLALYGSVPRTNRHELKELVSLGASQAKVQLDFEVGGTLYRVARRLPRTGAQSATVERLEGGEAVSEVDGSGVREANTRIEEIVGLDYPAFTRAVLLPQGEFAEFMKGDASKRRDILVRLLDLDRFVRAGKLANERAKEIEYEVTATEEVLAREYQDVDEDTVKKAELKAAEAQAEAAVVEGANQEAKDCWEEREGISRDLKTVEDISRKLANHASELLRIEEVWSGLREKDAETSTVLERVKEERRRAEAEERKAKKAWTQLTDEVGTEAVLIEHAETGKALKESERTIKTTSLAIEETEDERRELAERREDLKTRLTSAQAAEEQAKLAVEAATGAVTSAQRTVDRAARRASLIEQLQREKEDKASLEDDLRAADEAEAAGNEDHQKAVRRLQALQTEHSAAAIRVHLHVGDDCPVCGSVIGALPESDESAEAELKAAQAAQEAAEQTLREAGKTASARRSDLEGVAKNIGRIETELKELGDEASPSDSEDWLRTAEAREREARATLEAAARDVRTLGSELAECDQSLTRLDTLLAEKRTRIAETEEQAERCRSHLAEVLGDPLPSDYQEEIGRRQERLKGASSVLNNAAEVLEEARNAFDQGASDRRTFEGEVQELDGQMRGLRSLLDERREALTVHLDREAPNPPAHDTGDRDATLTVLAEHGRALERLTDDVKGGLEGRIEKVDAALSEAVTKAGVEFKGKALSAVLKVLDEKAATARVGAERAADRLGQLRERVARKEEMSATLAEKRSRMRLHEKVAGELRRDRFVSFLLDESFEDLALRASAELDRISDHRYSLAATGNGFAVVDHANADERRSVVTLSGGETFLASLALALALSQGITDIAGHSAAARLESMFIDEGFGSLDPTALDLAVEALERLREGERMVGVITHVPALAERIPDGIAVEKKDSGSVAEMR